LSMKPEITIPTNRPSTGRNYRGPRRNSRKFARPFIAGKRKRIRLRSHRRDRSKRNCEPCRKRIYDHHVETIISAGVHAVLARQGPHTSKEGAIHDSKRLFLRESWRPAAWGLLWVLCFKIAPNCEHSCTRQSLWNACNFLITSNQEHS
jgi:hypothetical protein